MREATARYLGRADIDQLDEKVLARVDVREQDGGYSVQIAVELPDPHPRSERRLDAASCEEAIDIAGLIISVALDPVAVTREVEPKSERETPEPPAPETPAPISEAAATPPKIDDVEVKDARRFDLRALGLLGFGQFESAAWGLSLGLDYGRGLWRAGIVGRYWGPQSFELEEQPGVGIRLQSAVAGVSGCVVPRYRSWRFASCAVVEGGFLSARGFGLERNEGTRLPLLALGVEQIVSFELHRRVSIDLALGTGVQFIRPRVEIDDLGVVFARGSVAFRAGLGPSLRF